MMRAVVMPFADLWTHRNLVWQFTKRNFELTIRGSHLGLLWSFLNPLLLISLYVGVFGFVFGGSYGVIANETRMDYAIGIFLSLSIFNLVSEVISVAPTVIISNPNFVKKVVFPLVALPAAAVGATLLRFVISITLVLLAMLVGGISLTWQTWLLIPVLIPLVLISLGLSWLFSSIGVFIRDIGQLTAFLTQALLYASAIFYPVHKIPRGGLWELLHYNPILQAIDTARDVVLWHLPLVPARMLYLYGVGLGLFVVGHLVFRRTQPAFADVL